MFNSGFIPSEIDGNENIFIEPKNIGLPKTYSYKQYLPEVINQGSDPICVPCSLSTNINWNINLIDGKPNDNGVSLFDIFDSRTTIGDGMTFKDAFSYLIENGVKTDKGIFKIKDYAFVPSIIAIKFAVVANGPCVGVLPVYNSDSADEFWNDRYGNFEGYHAVSIVGYDDNGLIIRNSWGEKYGKNGYTLIKNKDLHKFKEVWTIYV